MLNRLNQLAPHFDIVTGLCVSTLTESFVISTLPVKVTSNDKLFHIQEQDKHTEPNIKSIRTNQRNEKKTIVRHNDVDHFLNVIRSMKLFLHRFHAHESHLSISNIQWKFYSKCTRMYEQKHRYALIETLCIGSMGHFVIAFSVIQSDGPDNER